MPYQAIENHGVIGNLRTVALVAMDGSIDFMCFPRFDAPSVFAGLLDAERGGSFRIAPQLDHSRPKQLYLPDTNVLLTRFLSGDGVGEVSDFMPISDGLPSTLVRRAKCVRGEVRFRMQCRPRFDYARSGHEVEQRPGEVLFRAGDGTALRLRTAVDVTVDGTDATAEFCLRAGEHAAFVLEEVVPGRDSPSADPGFVSRAFKDTVNFWYDWIGRCTYQGRWREMVHRSALVLKLLTSHDHGSVVAAATFGLPEEIGGERNWDYRYTWIRDASFTVYALMRLGYNDEAGAFMRWIDARCGELNPDGSLQVMYGIDGRHDLAESRLDHFAGYRGSRPVRIGNGAFDHLQLDIYGELMDSVYLHNKYGKPINHDLWVDLVRLIDWVCNSWRQPDEGIWEVRGGRREFLYSRLMCWVAVDRGIRLSTKRSFPAPLERWLATRDEIYDDIFASFWDAERGVFVQHLGANTMDASALMMPLVKFISPSDPRWLSTLRAIEDDLVDDSLVYRYRVDKAASDGLSGTEGTFSICTFWFVECLARAGELDKARFIFEKMIGYANHLGLYAEEVGPSGEHLGNFPQAFTHLALISAAHYLDRALPGTG